MKLTKENHLDFIAQIADILEDFCEKNGVYIPNDNRETELDAIIYGDDYYTIENEISRHINQYLEKGEEVNTKTLMESTIMVFVEILKKGEKITFPILGNQRSRFAGKYDIIRGHITQDFAVTDENIKFFQNEIMKILKFWNL